MVSARVDVLAEGKDFRRFPKPIGEQQANAAGFRAARDLPANLSGKKAAELLPRALAIVRDGGNAFDDARSFRGKEMDALLYEDFLAETGDNAGAAMDLLLARDPQPGETPEEAAAAAEADRIDERTMRRRLADVSKAYGAEEPRRHKGGRKSRGKPPP